MIERILDYLRCPKCTHPRLQSSTEGLTCPQCGSGYAFRNGILDWLGNNASEVITPFQRVMQTPLVVSIYEGMWRRLGYRIASSRSFDREMETILQLQQRAPAERSLDLACGTGVFTRPLARNTRGIFVGFDLSWPMLREARRRLERESLSNVLLMRGTAFRLPFIDGAFQHVNCCGALHLFDQPDPALREIHRVLQDTGRLSVQTTIRPEHSGGTAYFLEHFIRFGFFTETDLGARLHQHGFKIIESERHRISYTFLACAAEGSPA